MLSPVRRKMLVTGHCFKRKEEYKKREMKRGGRGGEPGREGKR